MITAQVDLPVKLTWCRCTWYTVHGHKECYWHRMIIVYPDLQEPSLYHWRRRWRCWRGGQQTGRGRGGTCGSVRLQDKLNHQLWTEMDEFEDKLFVYMSSLFQKGLLVVWGYLMYEYLKEYFEIIWCVNEFSNGQNHAALKESGLQSIASQQSSLLITDLLVQTNTNNVINILTKVTAIQSYRNSHTTAWSSDTVTSLPCESRHVLAILVLWIMLVWN